MCRPASHTGKTLGYCRSIERAVTKLCADCDRAAHDPAFSNPMHLVHPEHGKFMVFDIYGMAVCPTCSAIWYRDHKGTVLLNERKPPKRAMPAPVKGRKPAKWVTGGNRT